jgi:hypothetical protein
LRWGWGWGGRYGRGFVVVATLLGAADWFGRALLG